VTNTVPIVASLEAAMAGCDAIFCDIWGVLHNGVTGFAAASKALARIRATGTPVVLLSNAPRPSTSVLPQLARLGVLRTAFDDILTSGDLTRDLIAARKPTRFVHIGPDRDGPVFEGLGVEPAHAEEAGYILCTGLLDDTIETPEDYRSFLSELVTRGLPMLCANPDLVIDRGGKEIYCAGALAQLYETLGGHAEIIGKPFAAVYEAALAKASRIAGRPLEPRSVLAIGDSFRTDIAGAAAFGAKTLLIASGIHSADFLGADATIDRDKAKIALAREKHPPDFLMHSLA
jgi:HAD superfamily hydrolase (TIGR01459 family)